MGFFLVLMHFDIIARGYFLRCNLRKKNHRLFTGNEVSLLLLVSY